MYSYTNDMQGTCLMGEQVSSILVGLWADRSCFSSHIRVFLAGL